MTVQHAASGSIAEDLFIELFSEAFGAEKAGYLYSQYHFYDIYQNSRYADFLLESNGMSRRKNRFLIWTVPMSEQRTFKYFKRSLWEIRPAIWLDTGR